MEKEKPYVHKLVDMDLRTVLFLWKSSPESTDMSHAVNGLLKRASDMGVNLTFKITDQIFEYGESRRAITRSDMERLARKDGDFWVFDFSPKRNKESRFTISVLDLYGGRNRGLIDRYNFVIRERNGENFTAVGIFRPHEIESINIKK